jgi:hypothetical protein
MFSFQYDIVQKEDRKGDRAPEARAREIMNKFGKRHKGRLSREEFLDGYAYIFNLFFLMFYF